MALRIREFIVVVMLLALGLVCSDAQDLLSRSETPLQDPALWVAMPQSGARPSGWFRISTFLILCFLHPMFRRFLGYYGIAPAEDFQAVLCKRVYSLGLLEAKTQIPV